MEKFVSVHNLQENANHYTYTMIWIAIYIYICIHLCKIYNDKPVYIMFLRFGISEPRSIPLIFVIYCKLWHVFVLKYSTYTNEDRNTCYAVYIGRSNQKRHNGSLATYGRDLYSNAMFIWINIVSSATTISYFYLNVNNLLYVNNLKYW